MNNPIMMNLNTVVRMFSYVMSALSCLFIAAYAGAAEQPINLTSLSIEELMNVRVYSASRYEQPVSEAPSSVTVVTADEIKHYGYRTLADILRSVRGFSMTYDRIYSYVGVRGVGSTGDWNSHVLVQINGHRTNENVYDSAMLGTGFPLDLDLIDRVEIVRGPGSSLYGDNAFFAVINVLTRNGNDLAGTEVAAGAGNLNAYNGRMSYGTRLQSGGDVLISASMLDSQGNKKLYFREFDTTNNGIAQNLDKDRNHQLFSKFSSGDFVLEGAYSERTKQVPTASYEALFNDPRYQDLEGRSYLDLAYSHTYTNDLKVRSRLFYDWYWYHSDEPYDGGGFTVMNKDVGKAHWWGAEVQAEKSIEQTHHVLAGLDYQRTPEVLLRNYDIGTYPPNCDITKSLEKWSLFMQDEIRLAKSLMLNAGARYDHYNTFGGTTNPRAALNFTPREGTAIKLLYGNAFRAPNAYELYFDAPNLGAGPNPDLEPERIRTLELVYEQHLTETSSAAVSVFQNRISHLISLDTSTTIDVYRNLDPVTAKGIEAEFERRAVNGVRGKVSYTYTRTHNDTTGEPLVNAPLHMAKLNLTFPMALNTVFLGVETQYMSSRKTLAGQDVSGYVITNLSLFGKELVRGLDLSWIVYNVFDKTYSDPGGSEHAQNMIEQDGRGYRVKLAYRF